MLERARELVNSGYQNSVLRRTALLGSLLLPAFAANFFLYFFAARLLAPEQFGVFYVAQTVANVLFSGSLIFNVFFTRHLVQVMQAAGEEGAIQAMRRLERAVVAIGLVCALVLFVGFLVAGHYVGVQSRRIILLIVLDAYTAYVADLGRVLLQTLRRTLHLGLYTLVWMLLRFFLCMAGILATGTAWAGLAGVVLSAVVMFVVFEAFLRKRSSAAAGGFPRIASPLALVLPVLGYGTMVLVSNVDVLSSYLLLSEVDVGIYSASSVFPKAILTVITPLLSMLLPLMVPSRELGGRSGLVVAKTLVVISGLSLAAALTVWLLSAELCGGRWGIKLCQASALTPLLMSAVPLALLRVIVTLQFANGRDLLMSWLAVPMAAFLYLAWSSERTVSAIANIYAGAALATLAFYLVVTLASELVRANYRSVP